MNKSQLAVFLSITLKTLGEWINRDSDFPVIVRGDSATDWVFDPIAVRKHVEERRAEREEAKRARLAQSPLPLPPGAATGASAKDDLARWQIHRLRRQEAEQAKLLVRADRMAEVFKATLARIGRDTHAFHRQLGREHNWPDSYVAEVAKRYADQQRQIVEALMAELDEPLAVGEAA